MRLLTLGEVLALHRRILAETGGAPGVRDLNAIASAVAQSATMASSTATNASATLRWKCSSSSTASRSKPPLTKPACTPLFSVRLGTAPQAALEKAIRVKTTEPRPTDAAHQILFSIDGQSDKDKLAEQRRTEEIP